MWETLKDTVGKVAPVAAGLLAGPGAGIAISAIAKALGTDEDPEQILKAIETDPTAVLKLRQVEADLEKTLISTRGEVVTAEAQGESWLQRNWRPMTMLSLVGLIGAQWLGLADTALTEPQTLALYGLVKLGLTGYVVGRSVEKVAKTTTGSGILEKLMRKS